MAGKRRRRNDDHLLMALACGATVEAAAHSAGVSPATAYRYLQDRAFRQRLQHTRSEMVKRSTGMLTGAAGEAVKTLLELMRGPTAPAVRLGAARATLELGMKQRGESDLEERLAAMEEHLGLADGRRR